VLFANYRTPREFNEAEKEILETFASHAAITIENAVLYRRACVDLDRTIAKLTALREVDKTITATVDESEVLSLILQSALRLTGARQGCGYVLLRDKDGEGDLRLAASLGIPAEEFNRRLGAGKTIVHRVKETGEPTLCPGSTKDCQLVAANARSGIAIPFQKGGKLMGVMGIESPTQQRFGSEDVNLLEAFSGQAVIAIENAKAYRALEETKQNQLLIVLGGVAAGMVERMRNTVSTIPWHVDAIREKVSAPPGQEATLREYLDLIEGAAQEASSEVEEVCNLIQSRSARTDKVAVGVLLKEAVKNIRRRAGERSGVALSLQLNEPDLYVQGDEVLVRKALERLIINGVQAIGGEGSVEIRSRVEDSGRNALIEVSDTGRGISPELLPDRLFELGVSARPGGLGIGLWFCRRIIEEHKGTIQVESKLGEGSTFTVTLPLSSPRRETGKGRGSRHGR
ncbi:MAG: GAF domain-containing sensor histidine kinase, partial [Dehalococcoidia bacterium]|nr:GAF domain-containing sensor histidine kinase [Dehalococcoidia bacterium]